MAGTTDKDGKGSSVKYQFPLYDLQSSIEVARAIVEKGGGVADHNYLAEFLGYKNSKSGTFFNRLQAARLFGLVEGRSQVTPTDQAKAIISPVMPEDEIGARFNAFCSIPLFREFFQRMEGHQLPPENGLVNLLKNVFGVDSGRAKVVLRILMDSAETAGLFDVAGNRTRMLRPRGGESAANAGGANSERVLTPKSDVNTTEIGAKGIPKNVHIAIAGILGHLPEAGKEWTSEEKQRFLAAFTAILEVVYPTKGSNGDLG